MRPNATATSTTTKSNHHLQQQPLPQSISKAFTAVVLKYVLDFDFGILRTQAHGNGLFRISSVAYCYKHKLNCKDGDCPDYKRFNPKDKGYNLNDILPLGTQVNVMAIPFSLDTDQIRFHASLVWPHMSKRPTKVSELDDADLNDLVANYLTWGDDGDVGGPVGGNSANPPGFAVAPGAHLKPAAFPKGMMSETTSTLSLIHI